MNRLQIETEARTLMAEKTASSSYADSADIINWINDGIKDMCIKGKVYPKTIPLNVVSADRDYNLPWDFIEPIRVDNHRGIPLDEIDLDFVGRTFILPGRPLYFYFTTTPITLSSWSAGTSYVVWPSSGVHTSTYIVPTTPNGYMYECIVSGTSHTTQPTWSTVLGTRQIDNTVTWICRELVSSLQTINLYDTPTTAGGGVGTYYLTYSALDGGLHSDQATPNFASTLHHYLIPYICYRWSIKNRDSQLAMAFYQEYAAGVGLQTPPPKGDQSAI